MRRTCTSLALTALALVATAGLAGCSSAAETGAPTAVLESDCDADGISEAAHHLLEEGGLTMGDVQELRCDGDWAVIRVGQSGAGAAADTATLVFRQTDLAWVMKAPEIACVDGPDGIPQDLASLACP